MARERNMPDRNMVSGEPLSPLEQATKDDDAVSAWNEAKPSEEDEQEESGRGMDEELKAISGMLRQLRRLDASARARVMKYLADRFAAE